MHIIKSGVTLINNDEENMFCENCGTKIPDNSSFCEECGQKVSSYMENETKISESKTNEENLNIKKEPNATRQRGSVPPVMRSTSTLKPSDHSREETNLRQASEPYAKETEPRKPSVNYEKEMVGRQHSNINRPVSDKLENNKTNSQSADIISFGQYVWMIFLVGIPILNIILLLKWGFNKKKPNKSNFAKALLFYYLIAVIIYVAYIYLWLKATSSI